MARGDHLHASRDGYHHDGIDLGNGRVVHYAADPDGTKSTACVRISTFNEFAGDGQVTIRRYGDAHDPETTVARAESRLGEAQYDLVFNNCEHFARWCVTGDHRSEQVVAVSSVGAAVGLPWLAANAGTAVVASAGFAGASGPGLMSGLATVGAAVGGGAVAGVVVLGAAPAVLGTALVAGHTFSDDQHLPAEERRARTAGRLGAVVGGAVGVGTVGWAISALGVPGLSAAGVTSGLAAIGGTVGGGMAVGATLAIALPTVGVMLGAYLLYRLWVWLEGKTASLSVAVTPPQLSVTGI